MQFHVLNFLPAFAGYYQFFPLSWQRPNCDVIMAIGFLDQLSAADSLASVKSKL